MDIGLKFNLIFPYIIIIKGYFHFNGIVTFLYLKI